MEIEFYKISAEEKMQKAIDNYKINLSKISTGKASSQILETIKVKYFEVLTPISQLANISVPDPRQLLIKPFDMSINKSIVATINASSLGVVAIDEGDKTRITFPVMTTERRNELVKLLGNFTEQAKILIRGARQDTMKQIKSDDDLSKDDQRVYASEIQKWTDQSIFEINKITKDKENDLLTM